MVSEQQAAFWDAIDVFDREGLLPYVMLIGSWAEYIYQFYFKSNFRPKRHVNKGRVRQIYNELPKKSQKIIDAVCEAYFIEIK